MKENYQIILNKTIDEIQKNNTVPSLLLHSCCAPCSSYVLEYLSEYFDITIFYYNPNISPEEEFYKRVSEQKRLINEMPLKRKVKFIEGKYDCEKFYSIAKGLENLKEGGERCFKCYRLRLEETAKIKCHKKLQIIEENHRNQEIPVIFGGDYWTRTSGLMRVKIR